MTHSLQDFLKTLLTEGETNLPVEESIRKEFIRTRFPKLWLKNSTGDTQQLQLDPKIKTYTFSNVTPSTYTLSIDSGCVLWEKRLSIEELYISEDEPLQMAAQSEELSEEHRTLHESLPEYHLTIDVHAGIKSGVIVVFVEWK